ncbi:MAG: phosphoglycerate dehydrogenase [Halanaerobiales bacterium]
MSDPISEKGIELLKKEGIEVDIKPDLTHDQLKEEIGQYDGIIVRSGTTLDSDILQQAERLKGIGRAGTGYDNIDVDAATKEGIVVFNTPNSNTISAVEHTVGMMLALSRNIPQANETTIRGKWERKKFLGVELYGKTLGIVGLGKIGTLVAERAHAFGMKVIAHDKYVSQKHADNINVELVSFEELIQKSDYISLHTPLTDETHHLLDKEEFSQMKEGVRIVNCARGGIINTEALADAIEEGKVAGAALDAHEEEPFEVEENPLTDYKDKVIMTCHLGASTKEAMDRVALNAVEQLLEVLEGKLPVSALNISNVKPGKFPDKPVLNLANRLGKFMAGYASSTKIEKIEVEFGKESEWSQNELILIHIIKEILDPVLDSRVNLVNALLVAEERDIEIKKSFIEKPGRFNKFLRVNIISGEKTYSAAGDVEVSGPQLVEVDGYTVELALDGKFLLLSYKDQPGVIGKIGSILGDTNINIGSMHVGRNEQGEQARTLIKTDNVVGKDVIENIKKLSEFAVDEVRYIEIDG